MKHLLTPFCRFLISFYPLSPRFPDTYFDVGLTCSHASIND